MITNITYYNHHYCHYHDLLLFQSLLLVFSLSYWFLFNDNNSNKDNDGWDNDNSIDNNENDDDNNYNDDK